MALSREEYRKQTASLRAGTKPTPDLAVSQNSSLRESSRKQTSEWRQKIEDIKKEQVPAKPTASIRGRFDVQESSLSMPSGTSIRALNQPASRIDRVEEERKARGQNFRDLFRRELGGLGTFLFGETEAGFRGVSGTDNRLNAPPGETGFVQGIRDDVRKRGAFKFLYQNITKGDDEKIAEGVIEARRQGYVGNEALNIATEYVKGNQSKVPENMRIALDAAERGRKAWAIVESLDAFPAFRAARSTMSRTVIQDTVEQAIQAPTNAEARRILAGRLRDLEGTKELDEIVRFTATVKDPVKGKQFVETVMESQARTPVAPTEAQRVVYENGVPVLRGGADAPVSEVIGVRDEIRTVLSGQKESSRLSNPAVFTDEVSAGTLPRNATPDAPIQVFTTSDSTTLRSGDRVALTREAIEAVASKGKAKMVEAMPDDLVRLDDGTFAYARKDVIGKDLTPSIKSVRADRRQNILEVERQRTAIARQEAIMERKAVEEARIARRKEAELAAIAREERVAKSKRLVEDAPKLREERKQAIVAQRAEEVEKVTQTARQSREAVSTAKKDFDSANKAYDATVKDITRAVKQRRASIERLKASRAYKNMTPTQRLKALAKLRKEADKNIEKLQTEKKKLNEKLNTAKTKLKDAGEKVIPRTEELKRKAEINARFKETKAQELRKIDETAIEATRALADEGVEVVKTKPKAVKETAVSSENFVKVFHGTDSTFDTFDNTAAGASKKSWTKAGHISLSTSKKVSRSYGENVKELYLDPGKQLVVDAKGKYWNSVEFRGEKMLVDDIAEIAQKEGYDSVKIANVFDFGGKDARGIAAGVEKADTIVVFDRNRVKTKVELAALEKAESGEKGVVIEGKPVSRETIFREAKKEVMETVKVAEAKQVKAIETGGTQVVKSAIARDIKDMLANELQMAGLTPKQADELVNPLHRVAANQAQIDNAINRVAESPMDEYDKFLRGEFLDDTSRAATELVLLRHPLIKADPEKVMNIIKKSSGNLTTRIAQEQQARSMLRKTDPHTILRRLQEFQADLVKRNEVGLAKENKQIMEQLGNDLASLKVADTDEVIDIISKNTCDV